MKQTELHLTDEDRTRIEEICSKGVHRSREVNRAHALSCLDRGVPQAQISTTPTHRRKSQRWRVRCHRRGAGAGPWSSSSVPHAKRLALAPWVEKPCGAYQKKRSQILAAVDVVRRSPD